MGLTSVIKISVIFNFEAVLKFRNTECQTEGLGLELDMQNLGVDKLAKIS